MVFVLFESLSPAVAQTPETQAISSPQARLNQQRSCVMAISGDLVVSSALAYVPTHPLRPSLPPSRVGFTSFLSRDSNASDILLKWTRMESEGHSLRCQSHQSLSFGILGDDTISSKPVNEETEGFLLNAINLSFLERLDLAWKILFPPPATRRSSNARIAKQRLKMILFSDRCAVSDEAKQKIVSNIVGALSDFVEIESQDKVQLSVSTDPDMGTVYSVTVPVRRVKSAYRDDEEYGMITNVEYKDKGEQSGSVDVKFDFFLPNQNMQ